ncbi:hypothetical protein CR164_03275 [Prosthecochloris marina]|uniref:TIR domain-containing protein n=1 Tax=Prosthecochloris marina TaxID=2017681 RepID=A0A317TAT1_9CHLB|nr:MULTISPECIES: hypothetical protein [Prosthecochloris]PWW82776.1 hypothetical protein CR164_03275 [Prosthecochloris marina]
MKIFWSYARLDDMKPKRKISKLRKEFENVLSQTVGKKCEVFFDTDSLNWGVKWREEIGGSRKAFKNTFKEDGEEAEINRQLNKASFAIADLQMMDFRELRNEKLDSKKVENFLDRMAGAVGV